MTDEKKPNEVAENANPNEGNLPKLSLDIGNNKSSSELSSTPQEKESDTEPAKTLDKNNEFHPIIGGNRKIITDFYVSDDILNVDTKFMFSNFTRLNAKKKRFVNVKFEHCIFDNCYFNECVFDSCIFTGARFIACKFQQTAFTGCKFDYTIFERTHIDDHILKSQAPLEENLRMRFARSLRMNYQQIGDAKAVNAAISLELEATSVYLWKSWTSTETYYFKKYKGFDRIKQFIRWLDFRILDFIWGNGESVLKLFRTVLLVVFMMSIYDTTNFHKAYDLRDYINSFSLSSAIFFGFTPVGNGYSYPYIALIAALRLILVALFTAILVKRFSRR